METKYPTLKRPKRKLCYPTNKESPSRRWSGQLLMEDVSRMFDDLDSASHEDCYVPPSLLLDIENNQGRGKASDVPQEGPLTEKPPALVRVPKEDDLHLATRSTSRKLGIGKRLPPALYQEDLDTPFIGHGPVKTSSPIERDMGAEEQDNEKDQAVSPILFFYGDKDQEEAKTEPLPIQEPQTSGLIKEESDHFNLESPPSKIILSKPKSSHKNKVPSCRQENADLPVSAMKQKSEHPAPEKNSESVHKQPVRRELRVFLQKLRDAGQPKPARKLPSPVKVPPCPPEPEDDFLILEDDTPIRFSILSKTATKKKQRQSKTSSTDKDSSTDKGVKDVFVPLETTRKQQVSDQANRKRQSKTVNQKIKKKGKEREKEVMETENNMDQNIRSTPEDQQRADKHKDTASSETDEESSSKPQWSSEVKGSSRYKTENAKTSKAKSLKWTRKEMQGSDGVKEQRSSEQDADVEDLGSLSDKELKEAQTANVKTKQNKQSAVSTERSSVDDQVRDKRKRKQTGQWWLSCPKSTEETKVPDNQPVLKRSKQNSKGLGAEVSPPVKSKNEVLLKQRHHNTNKKRNKINKHGTTEDNPNKMKATVEPHMIGSELIEDQEQQQDVLDQDQDLVLPHRDHSFNSGDRIFQRVYHHSGSEKMSSTPAAPVSPSRPSEQLGTTKQEKRRRKPPGAWWRVDNPSEDMESIFSQPQQLNPKEPKPNQERKNKRNKSPELWTARKGNTAVSPKPPGGAPVTPLKPRRAPETAKRTLATFKDIFTSPAESPAVLKKRDAGQNNRCDVPVCPAEGSATDGTTLSNTNKEILSIDAGDSDHESPPARRCLSMSTVFRSGPSSMIEVEQDEENDDMVPVLPPTRADDSTLPVLDLCAPPLKPLVLQAKDKVNLAGWLKSLWPATENNGAEITPDHFDWYFYQGRAIGFLQDLQSGSILNGKILLGSYMKKPLWVDHSATTVFNLLTSSVSVTVDCNETRFNPGRSFMVESGHAYSIQNLTSQPAVLCFTRILIESPN